MIGICCSIHHGAKVKSSKRNISLNFHEFVDVIVGKDSITYRSRLDVKFGSVVQLVF